MQQDDLIQVTIRTGTTGHETVALPLDELPGFIDRKRDEGQLAIATSGDASVIVRIGRESLDFFRGRRANAIEEGRPREKEEVTVLNPLAGGSNATDAGDAPLVAAVLSAATAARVEGSGNNQMERAPEPQPLQFGGAIARARSAVRPLDAMAEMRAWRGLVAQEGEAAVTPLLHGGGVAVRSSLWPTVVYLVKTDWTLVLREGQVVQNLCLQPTDGAPVWDAVADRLQLLRAGPEGEVAVWAAAAAR